MRKDYMMTLVRARPPWCYVMPQVDVITVDNWVPTAWSKPLVKLADSAMRFTPKECETPSAFTVAERNVCALIRSEDSSDGSSRDGLHWPGGPANLRRCADYSVEKLGLSAVSNDGAGNCMFEALCQAFAKAGKAPTDARTVRTAVVAKMMIQRGTFQACFLWDRWCGRAVHVETVLHWHEKGRGVGWLQRIASCRGALEPAHCCCETWSCDIAGGQR